MVITARRQPTYRYRGTISEFTRYESTVVQVLRYTRYTRLQLQYTNRIQYNHYRIRSRATTSNKEGKQQETQFLSSQFQSEGDQDHHPNKFYSSFIIGPWIPYPFVPRFSVLGTLYSRSTLYLFTLSTLLEESGLIANIWGPFVIRSACVIEVDTLSQPL